MIDWKELAPNGGESVTNGEVDVAVGAALGAGADEAVVVTDADGEGLTLTSIVVSERGVGRGAGTDAAGAGGGGGAGAGAGGATIGGAGVRFGVGAGAGGGGGGGIVGSVMMFGGGEFVGVPPAGSSAAVTCVVPTASSPGTPPLLVCALRSDGNGAEVVSSRCAWSRPRHEAASASDPPTPTTMARTIPASVLRSRIDIERMIDVGLHRPCPFPIWDGALP